MLLGGVQRAILIDMRIRGNIPSVKQPTSWPRPDFIATSVADIDFAFLASRGIKACFIDLDGTVVARGEFIVDPLEIQALKSAGLPIFIATNRPKSRALKNLKADLTASGIIHPHGLRPKPSKSYYRKALAERKLEPHQVVMIGDRYIQDIWGANRAGLYSLVVYKTGGAIGRWDRLLSRLEAAATS